MDCVVYLLGILTMGVARIASAADTLQVLSNPADFTMNEGSELELPCTIEGFGFSMFYNAIIWHKLVGSELSDRVQINTNAFVNEPFVATGRYRLAPREDRDPELPRIQLPLVISDISLAENGTYLCELWGTEDGVIGSVLFNLFVYEPIAELNLTTNATTVTSDAHDDVTVFEFSANGPSAVACVSRGGNPRPTLRMFRDEFDITHMFSEYVTNTTTGPMGLQVVTYEITLAADSFAAQVDYNGQHLKCIAHIHHAGQPRKETKALMDVQYPPMFSCAHHVAVELSTQQYELVCAVRANPPVDMDSISWTIGDNGTNVTVGESREGYAANATVDGDHVTVTLTIAEVNSSSYQPYNLTASNSLGKVDYQIILSPVTTTQAPPPTTTPDYRTSTISEQNAGTPRAVGSNRNSAMAVRPVERRMIAAYATVLFVGRILCGR